MRLTSPFSPVLVTRELIDTGGSAIPNLANLEVVDQLTNLANLNTLDSQSAPQPKKD